MSVGRREHLFFFCLTCYACSMFSVFLVMRASSGEWRRSDGEGFRTVVPAMDKKVGEVRRTTTAARGLAQP